MQLFSSCDQAIRACMQTQTFSIARLSGNGTPKGMHIHDCYELYYSISGGKQFLIENRLYRIEPGDLFLINQYETHRIDDADWDAHERLILNFDPQYVKSLSTPSTDLDACFSCHPAGFQHRISLSPSDQQRFLSCIDRIADAEGYGSDILEKTAITELLVMLNCLSSSNAASVPASDYAPRPEISEILFYINRNLSAPITIGSLANQFYISPSYLCRIFRSATGITVNRYITARRITLAKKLLHDGYRISEVCERAGFSDYSNFYKSFKKEVGVSPKRYALLSRASSPPSV